MKVSIIVPAYNEQDNIAEVINMMQNSLDFPYELIVVNDHSDDNTRKIVAELSYRFHNIRLIDNELERGFANAMKGAFLKVTGDVVMPVMADLCDDLSSIRKMLERINEGYDVVCGCRYIKGGVRLGGPKLKAALSFLGGWSIRLLLGIPTHDIANSFKMYRKKVIDNIQISSVGFEISMEILLKAYFLGFKITEVPTLWKERTKGKSSFKVYKLLPNYLKLYVWAIFKKLIQ